MNASVPTTPRSSRPSETPAPGNRPAPTWQLADEPTPTFTLIRRLLRISWRRPVACLTVLGLHLMLVVFQLTLINLIGLSIDFIRKAADHTAPDPQWLLGLQPPESWPAMLTVGVLAGGIIVIAATLARLHYFTVERQSRLIQTIITDLRTRIYNRMQRLSFRFFDSNETGSIINRVMGDVQAVRQFLNMVVIQSITLSISIVVFAAWMAKIHVGLTIACLLTMPFMAISAMVFGRIVKPAYKHNRKLRDKLVLALSENVQGVHVVKGFAMQDQQIAHFKQANNAVHDQSRWIFWRVAIYQPVMHMLPEISMFILLAYGGVLMVTGQIALGGGLVVFAGLLGGVAQLVTQLSQITDAVHQSLSGAQRVFEVIDAPPEITSPAHARPLVKARGEVRFDHVSFAYREHDPVLHDIDLHVEPGECVAVVGATGAGKSTLLQLLPRFYDPTEGRILIDGVDIREYDVSDLRRQIGLVFQETFLFSNTIAGNIAFGSPGASRQQVIQAAKIAAAHDFISELPDGYDTIIGERGMDLSGGQRQRLAIARAVLLEPPILLLDDATAAVDPETEHEILEAMDNAMRGRTTFVVAHRLSTLRRAGQVIVLDKGRIIQAGAHEHLMASEGPYRNAASLQAADDESRRLLGLEPAGGGAR